MYWGQLSQLSEALCAYSRDLQEICRPLFVSSPIKDFSLIRVYTPSRVLFLSSNTQWVNQYVQQEYITNSIFLHGQLLASTEYLVLDALRGAAQTIITDARENFDIEHSFTMIEPEPDKVNFYVFSMATGATNAINYYLNQLDLLRAFTYYFKDQASKLLKSVEQKQLFLRGDEQDTEAHQMMHMASNSDNDLEFSTQYYYVNGSSGSFRLSARERQCLEWTARGKTAHEIAMILSISQRTVEAHLNNMKNKFGCYRLSELIYKAHRAGLIA